MRTQPPAIRRPSSERAFRDIHVPKLLGIERNIKKISYDFARHFANILRNLPCVDLSILYNGRIE